MKNSQAKQDKISHFMKGYLKELERQVMRKQAQNAMVAKAIKSARKGC